MILKDKAQESKEMKMHCRQWHISLAFFLICYLIIFYIQWFLRHCILFFRVLTPEKMTEEQRNEKLAAIKVAYPLNNEKQNGTVLFTK